MKRIALFAFIVLFYSGINAQTLTGSKLEISSIDTHLAQFLFQDYTTRPRLDIWGSPNKINLRTTYGNVGADLSLGTNTVNDALFIAENGNIGIGTATPNDNFSVNNKFLITNDGIIKWGGLADLGFLSWDVNRTMIGGQTSSALALYADGYEKVKILTNGNVGIGISSPSSKLHIFSQSNPQMQIRSGSTGLRGLWTTVNDAKEVISFNSSYNTAGSYPIIFEFGNNEKIRFSPEGNVGIGTTTPNGKLVINNDNAFNNSESSFDRDHIIFTGTNPLNGGYFGALTWNSSGRRRASIVAVMENDDSDHVGLAFFTRGTDGPGPMYESMRISRNGNVGIGTTTPTSLLTVAGKIGSREVKVSVADGADFVFHEDYPIKNIEEVEAYVKENKHLPEIASATEMKENGIELGAMNIKLLQKIEELTLYLIEQNKRLNKVEAENEELKGKIENLGLKK